MSPHGLIVAALTARRTRSGSPAPAPAAIWTPVDSNTTEDITAIEYQGTDRIWFATGPARSSVVPAAPSNRWPPLRAWSSRTSSSRTAVRWASRWEPTARCMRSANGGETWAPGRGHRRGASDSDENDLHGESSQPIGDVDSIRLTPAMRGRGLPPGGSQIYRTVAGAATAADVGSAAAGWQWINDDGRGRLQGPARHRRRVPDPRIGRDLLHRGAASAASGSAPTRWRSSATGEARQRRQRLHHRAPRGRRSRQRQPRSGRSRPAAAAARTSRARPTAGTHRDELDDRQSVGARTSRDDACDVDFAGGTVLAAGSAGLIMHSIDGATFFYDGADGELATRDWRSVGLASATEGAVGGTGGKLVLTSQANVTPDVVAPTGTISGPTSLAAGQAGHVHGRAQRHRRLRHQRCGRPRGRRRAWGPRPGPRRRTRSRARASTRSG